MHTVRPATMADAEILFAWRNDPGTRAMCLSTEPVAWDDHVRWLQGIIADPGRELSIHESNGVPCGTTRLDWEGGSAEFSITVAPEFRGRFVVKPMYDFGLPEAECIGLIKRENVKAQRLVAHYGFALINDGPLQKWVRPAAGKIAA